MQRYCALGCCLNCEAHIGVRLLFVCAWFWRCVRWSIAAYALQAYFVRQIWLFAISVLELSVLCGVSFTLYFLGIGNFLICLEHFNRTLWQFLRAAVCVFLIITSLWWCCELVWSCVFIKWGFFWLVSYLLYVVAFNIENRFRDVYEKLFILIVRFLCIFLGVIRYFNVVRLISYVGFPWKSFAKLGISLI